jgi:hypothetical protein
MPAKAETIDSFHKNHTLQRNSYAYPPKLCECPRNPDPMKDKTKAIKWLCLTLLVAAGLKYLPSYMVEQRRLDMQERALDLREEAFLRQQIPPQVSVPAPSGVRDNSTQLL